MRRNIGLLLTYEQLVDLDTSLSGVTFQDVFEFNRREINLLGARESWSHDAIVLKLTHPEFDEVSEGCVMPYYYIGEARSRYPFLFTDTNPLLYRKFKKESLCSYVG